MQWPRRLAWPRCAAQYCTAPEAASCAYAELAPLFRFVAAISQQKIVAYLMPATMESIDLAAPTDRTLPGHGAQGSGHPCYLRASDNVHPELDSEDAFRVMNLQPGVGSDELRFHFEVVYHEDVPSYEAISYVWGDATRKEVIETESGYLEVTKNLADALRAIRDPTTERCLWADAVCINQADVLERNHQVRQMAELFANADNVLVWLGTDPDLSGDAAFDCVRVLADPNQRDSVMEDVEYSRYAIDLLRSLKSRPWFRRLWTTQKIGLASHGICLCGDSRIEWRLLAAAYDFLLRHPTSMGILEEAEKSELDVHLVRKWTQHTGLTFLELVESVQFRRCTDPRDRIFALLAHPSATVEDEYSGQRRSIIDADYRLSLSRGFQEAVIGIIQQSRNLDVLSHVRRYHPGDSAIGELPSWVPDWSKPWQLFARARASGQACGSPDGLPRQNLPDFSVEGKLQTIGIRCDRISQAFPSSKLSFIYMWKAEFFELLEGPISETSDWSNTLCNLLFDKEASLRYQRDLRKSRKTQSPLHEFRKLKRLTQRLGDLPGTKTEFIHLLKFIESDIPVDRIKTPFVTDGGRIGVAFLHSSDWRQHGGSDVFVLERGRVPYILRGTADGRLRSGSDGAYHLVADCYIPSLMNGEAWTLPSARRQRVTII